MNKRDDQQPIVIVIDDDELVREGRLGSSSINRPSNQTVRLRIGIPEMEAAGRAELPGPGCQTSRRKWARFSIRIE